MDVTSQLSCHILGEKYSYSVTTVKLETNQ
jgi:hypothetical protein